MPWPTTYVDVEGAVRDWVNRQTLTLVGAGMPLPLGAHLARMRSPYRGSYVLLSRVGGGPDGLSDVNVDAARVSGAVYGVNRKAAAEAAVGYGNLLTGFRPPAHLTGCTVHAVTDVSGPLWLPDGVEDRYIVDAVFHIQPS